MPDFWIVLGHDYEVIIFETLIEAEQAKEALEQESDAGYYQIFEGRYGDEFSGWIGNHD